MSQIINLNKFRKAKARAEKRAKAAENDAIHGQSKAAKLAARKEKARQEKSLDGKQIETPEE